MCDVYIRESATTSCPPRALYIRVYRYERARERALSFEIFYARLTGSDARVHVAELRTESAHIGTCAHCRSLSFAL